MAAKALIFTVKIGGVTTVSNTLKKYLEERNLEVKICYFDDVIPKVLYSILLKGWYQKKWALKIKFWTIIYYLSFIYRIAYLILSIFPLRWTCVKLTKEIKDFNPHYIFAASFLPSFFAKNVIQKSKVPSKVYSIISNFDVPYFWDNRSDMYLLPHHELSEMAIKIGLPANRIQVTGLPINISTNKDTPKDVILVMGGKFGIGIEIDILKLASTFNNYKIVVICGTNEKLKDKLSKKKQENLIIHGDMHADNIYNYYSKSICVITKAGTITLAEAALRKIPIIICDYIEGHELKNMTFMLNRNACYNGTNGSNIPLLVQKAIDMDEDTYTIIQNAYNIFSLSLTFNIDNLIEN